VSRTSKPTWGVSSHSDTGQTTGRAGCSRPSPLRTSTGGLEVLVELQESRRTDQMRRYCGSPATSGGAGRRAGRADITRKARTRTASGGGHPRSSRTSPGSPDGATMAERPGPAMARHPTAVPNCRNDWRAERMWTPRTDDAGAAIAASSNASATQALTRRLGARCRLSIWARESSMGVPLPAAASYMFFIGKSRRSRFPRGPIESTSLFWCLLSHPEMSEVRGNPAIKTTRPRRRARRRSPKLRELRHNCLMS
jgi:hypothetical protein